MMRNSKKNFECFAYEVQPWCSIGFIVCINARVFPVYRALTAWRHIRRMTRRTSQRRITDHLRAIFHEACEARNLPVAEILLNTLIKRVATPRDLPSGIDRRKAQDLAGPCERLANLQLQQPHTEPSGEDHDGQQWCQVN